MKQLDVLKRLCTIFSFIIRCS